MNAKDLRIVYMGTPDFAVAPLRELVELGYNIVAVVTTPDRPSGRGLKVNQSAVKKYAVEAGLKILQPEKLRDPDFLEEFRSLRADLGIVIAFRMLPEVVWSRPRLGTFNLHASLLPQYRGAAPIHRAVMNGEKITGITTFFLNHEIDKGDIIARREVGIGREDTAGDMHEKLMCAGTGLVVETVEAIATGQIQPLSQIDVPEDELKTAPKIFQEDCRIDWTRPAGDVYNFIRGLSPYPAAWTLMSKKGEPAGLKCEDTLQPMQVKIYFGTPEVTPDDSAPGTIVSDGRGYIKVKCADGYISVDELQLCGKRRMCTCDFLCGFREDIENYIFC